MNIEDHEFYDAIANIKCEYAGTDSLTLGFDSGMCIFLSKEDVIAMAKHFKLIEEEL